MGRASAIQTSFNAGELSPRMMGRVDQAVYQVGVETAENFVPLIQGPMLKRSGTVYVGAPKAECRLIPFVPFVTQAYMIEASLSTFRFYTNNARIETAPDTAYEVATPWTLAQVRALDYQQSNDVIYFVHGDVQPRKLTRTGAETFSLAEIDFGEGPFDDSNIDEAITITVSATTGSITVTASSGIFAATDVGALFRIEAKDFSDIKAWEPSQGPHTVGDVRRSLGKVYEAVALSDSDKKRTGTVQPDHSEGDEWDGTGGDMVGPNDVNSGGVKWRYLYDRFGIVEITGFTSATEVTATVVRRLADSLTSVASWRWAHGAFSETRGWPSAVAIWNERLVLAKDATLYGSVVGDYETFRERNSSGEITPDMAFRITLPDPNPIRWIRADRQLLVGAADGEYVVGPASSQGAVGPGNIQVQKQSSYGSAAVKPLPAASRLLFVQRAARKLRELGYSFESDRYEAPDLTVLADHIGAPGIAELAYQQEPDSLAWARRGDGTIAALTYSPTQAVKGWSRHPLGGDGYCEAIACMPDPSGDRDQLWLAVERDGARAIERLAKLWEPGDARADAFFVDSGLSYSGAAVTTVSGLDHLIGRTVQVLADGSPHADRVVSGAGAITLSRASTSVHAGLGFTARLKTLTIEAGGEDGTAQGKKKRIVSVVLRLLETLGIRIGVQGGAMQPVEHRIALDAMDGAVPLFTGDQELNMIGNHDRFGQIELESFQPLPACIVATIPTLQVSAR